MAHHRQRHQRRAGVAGVGQRDEAPVGIGNLAVAKRLHRLRLTPHLLGTGDRRAALARQGCRGLADRADDQRRGDRHRHDHQHRLQQARTVALACWPQALAFDLPHVAAAYLALLAALQSRPQAAAQLLGCADASFQQISSPLQNAAPAGADSARLDG